MSKTRLKCNPDDDDFRDNECYQVLGKHVILRMKSKP
jgi:hypothetical protein